MLVAVLHVYLSLQDALQTLLPSDGQKSSAAMIGAGLMSGPDLLLHCIASASSRRLAQVVCLLHRSPSLACEDTNAGVGGKAREVSSGLRARGESVVHKP